MAADSKSTERASRGPASAAPDAGGEVRASGAMECGACRGSGAVERWDESGTFTILCARCSGLGLVWPKPEVVAEAEEPEGEWPPTGENPRNVTMGGVLGWFDR